MVRETHLPIYCCLVNIAINKKPEKYALRTRTTCAPCNYYTRGLSK